MIELEQSRRAWCGQLWVQNWIQLLPGSSAVNSSALRFTILLSFFSIHVWLLLALILHRHNAGIWSYCRFLIFIVVLLGRWHFAVVSIISRILYYFYPPPYTLPTKVGELLRQGSLKVMFRTEHSLSLIVSTLYSYESLHSSPLPEKKHLWLRQRVDLAADLNISSYKTVWWCYAKLAIVFTLPPRPMMVPSMTCWSDLKLMAWSSSENRASNSVREQLVNLITECCCCTTGHIFLVGWYCGLKDSKLGKIINTFFFQASGMTRLAD